MHSFLSLIQQSKPIKITKLSSLVICDSTFDNVQCRLIADAVRRTRSLTHLEFGLGEYNLVYLLQSILPTHPTIRSVTFRSDTISSRFVELAPVQKMIQESHWTQLKVIIPERCAVHTDLLSKICRAVSQNNTITTLDLSKCVLDDNLTDLIRLFEVNNTVHSLFIQYYGDITRLAQVLEDKKQLTSFGIRHLAFCEESNWTALARALQANPSLTLLDLHTKITSPGLVDILNNNQLKILEVNMCEEELKAVYEALLNNTSLTALAVDSQRSGNEALSRVFEVHPSLKHLSINISKDDLDGLVAALAHNKTICSVKISEFSYLPGQWSKLKDIFTVNNTLQSLVVSSNCLDPEDWPHLAEGLRVSRGLKCLTLIDNLPELSYFQVLCEGLKVNKSLTELTFLQVVDDVHDEYVACLFVALKENTTLRLLTIEANESTKFLGYTPSGVYEILNVECLDLSRMHMVDDSFRCEVTRLGHNRKAARRAEATNLIVSLFTIARSPELRALFPREIWLHIFEHTHSNYFDVRATAQAIFDDTTPRRVVLFDLEVLPDYCAFVQHD